MKTADNCLFSVLAEIADERRRQVTKEGWTPQHDDDEHGTDDLACAAACYALPDDMREMMLSKQRRAPAFRARFRTTTTHLWRHIWPFTEDWWKPKDRRRDLVRAGALIVAEIERIDRAKERAA